MHKKSRQCWVRFIILLVVIALSIWMIRPKKQCESGVLTILRVNTTQIQGIDYLYIWVQNQNEQRGDCFLKYSFKDNEDKKYEVLRF